ncbi:peptidase M23 [Bacillus coahuilensis m2-6]|uniref:M23 family metallopeptidase n=1 Tax=Bacillus coahuilensis TaxID=408580 RepID=UPI00075024A0|nr:M23 family metallopeptidase [Bacillus coahuilensis]KUP09995.1 peptidase M23 [Bacillus coahuilensis m2-6]
MKGFQTTQYLQKLNTNLVKKAIVTTVLVSTLTVHTVSAKNGSEAKSNFETVYHVYMNNEYFGVVSNPNELDQYIDSSLKEATTKYDIEVSSNGDVKYVSEMVFNPHVNNQEVMDKVKASFVLEAEAAAIVIGDNEPIYVQNEEQAEEVLRQIKLQYVSEKELLQFDTQPSSIEALPPLAEDETRISKIYFKQSSEIKKTKVDPSHVLSVDEAIQLLLKGTLEEKKYTVQEGDVLGSIASKHDLSTEQLLSLNKGMTDETVLQIGDELHVTFLQPYIQVAVEYETKKKETIAYENEVVEDDTMWKGDTAEVQEGADGERVATYSMTKVNGVESSKEMVKEEIIKEVQNHIVKKGTKVVPSRGTGNFAWPATGGHVTSHMGARWGSFHKGMDIAGTSGKAIKAADNGTVVFAGWDSGGYGNKVIIDHNNGFRTLYAHLSSIDVSVGQTVSQGMKLGNIGATGNSTGVHLHLEVTKNGSLVNPADYF